MADKKHRSLMIWVGLAFALLIAAWVTFFVIAAKHPVEEVPLQTPPKRAR